MNICGRSAEGRGYMNPHCWFLRGDGHVDYGNVGCGVQQCGVQGNLGVGMWRGRTQSDEGEICWVLETFRKLGASVYCDQPLLISKSSYFNSSWKMIPRYLPSSSEHGHLSKIIACSDASQYTFSHLVALVK